MKSRGSAVVELVLWISVVALLMAGSMEVLRVGLWQLRLLSTARLSAVLVGCGRIHPSMIEHEVRDYFQQWPGFDPSTLRFSVDRFLGVPSAPFYKLMSSRLQLQRPSGTLETSVQTVQEESS